MSNFGVVKIKDGEGNLVTKREGNLSEVNTSDDNMQQVLFDILKELKIMNIHLSILTDNNITNQEVE